MYQLVVFTLDQQRYAVSLPTVERIVRLVEITPIPHAPEIVLGLINVQGRILPVVDLRGRLRLPARGLHLSDHLLIVRTPKRTMALVVDAASDVITLSAQEVVTRETIFAHLGYVAGVAKGPDGLILIHDLEAFLSLEEEQALHDLLDSVPP
jgi:purine-binding chemotaxis protein CheW